ncbi:DJ-1/PfpI family protein [Gloeobacter morelensis]|uniref:DJ-1/PfpI family protein n=1 Tax=Gloeobacter morelensis MG652769 TaxID=2781736 RepID=A0ABY3PI63_9CYAN|nr:DJ-1/PfpI family protein [Gloeobacter morelensis]UFP93308.1 DJ-1/PfpI family protein [Gloeobacter morelensis MG652769]
MRTVGIVIFDDVEVLDLCGPFEVFSVARADGDDSDEQPLFEVLTIAEHHAVVRCVGGLQVQPQAVLADHPPLDIVIVPGGIGTRKLLGNQQLLQWIAGQHRTTEVTASVCTGALLLAEAGLLDGRRATTHWSVTDWMRSRYTQVEVLENTRFVDEGKILTSAGISAGIDMSLHLVSRLHGPQVARWTARRMEYDHWPVQAAS